VRARSQRQGADRHGFLGNSASFVAVLGFQFGQQQSRDSEVSATETRRRELIACVRAGVAVGIPLEELNSLRDLLSPDRVEVIIEHYWQKNGERPSLYTIDLASKLLALARSETLSEIDIERLEEIRLALEEYRSTGLTEKNRKLIRQIAQSDVWREVVRLPLKLMEDARRTAKTKPYRSRRHGAARHRHPDTSSSTHAEPLLDLHRRQSGQAGRTRSALHVGLPRL